MKDSVNNNKSILFIKHNYFMIYLKKTLLYSAKTSNTLKVILTDYYIIELERR